MTIKVVSFDFDGVFVRDSDAVFKKEAWKIALAPYAPEYEPFLIEGNSNYGGGKSGGRIEIMRHVFESLGKSRESIEDLVRATSEVFDNYVQSKILEAGLVHGALSMLQDLSQRGLVMYLNSSTATLALRRTAHNLEISTFFKGILGSTPEPVGGSKVSNLSYIAREEHVSPLEVLMVGDGQFDEKAAEEFGCNFVGVSNIWNKWSQATVGFSIVTDLRDVQKFV